MRTIKFRGINIGGEWCSGLLSISQGLQGQPFAGLYISNRAGMPWAYQIRPETLGEFTGLKDKNGREIYEGDVCKFLFRIEKLSGIGKVYWSEEGACWSGRTSLPFNLHTALEIEVIGNIYENPELLKN